MIKTNPLTERLINLMLNMPFGIIFEPEEGVTQKHFGKAITLSIPTPGIITAYGDNGKVNTCTIEDTCHNGYVRIKADNGKFYNLFSEKLGAYIKKGAF